MSRGGPESVPKLNWDEGTLGSAIDRLDAGASVNSDKDEAPDFESYPCILKTGAVKNGTFDPLESKKIAKRDLWRLKVWLRKGTILISRMNTAELVGESGYVSADHPNLFVPDRLWMASIRGERADARWLAFVLTWAPIKSAISATGTGTSGSMKNISKPALRGISIVYPPVPEQRAIADALSDADQLVQALGDLIRKKRAIKQGAMQQLLTGETRLPGFESPWREGTWRDVVNRTTGGSTPSRERPDYFRGNVPWVTSGELRYGIIASTAENLSKGGVDSANLELHPPGTFLMAITGMEAEGTRGSCGVLGIHATTNQSCLAVYPNERVRSSYLFQYYCLRGKSLALQFAQGTKQQSFTGRTVLELPISFPEDPLEQDAITGVLEDMQAEIDALEALREKARAIKEGMMQALLSGRMRIAVSKPVEVPA